MRVPPRRRPTPVWTPEMLDRVRALATQGFTAKRIATELGMTLNAVQGTMAEHDIKRVGGAQFLPPLASLENGS